MQEARRRIRNERRYRRRRRTAAASLVALVAVAVVVAVVLSGSGGGDGASGGLHPASAALTAGASGAAATRTASTPAAGTRTASTGAARHLVRVGPNGTEPVPILMYHVIGSPPPGAPFPGLYVTQSLFAAQMHALAAAGYHAVTMNQMWDNWHHGTALPAGKPIVVSFDNGYESQKLYALPVLRAMGWVGVENLQLSGLPFSQGGLNQTEVRDLLKAGWELDTQGWNHADLITLSPSELRFQVLVARRRLQAHYHVPVEWFCYPSGQYDAAVIAMVKAAGFRGATTVVPGWARPAQDPYTLPRLRVLNGTSPESLLAEIAGIRSDAPPGPSYSS